MSTLQPDFDRFHSVISRKSLPDRVPIAENHVDISIMEAFLGKPINDLKTYALFWKKAGYDYVLLEVRGQFIADSFQIKIVDGVKQAPKEITSVSTFETARIKDERSFDEYPWVSPNEVYYKDVDLIEGQLPDGMKIVISHGPIFSGMMRTMGLEVLSIAYFENPQLLRAVADKFGDLTLKIIENLVQRPSVGAIWFGDDIAYSSSLIVSPAFLQEYIFPFYKKIGDLCRRYKKLFIYHSDGKLEDVFHSILDCGVHAVHPNEPQSVDIVQMKQQWGDRVAFVGNIDIDLLARGMPEDVVKTVRYLIDNVAIGGGFALGSGNSIASYIPLSNYKAMLAAVHKYGQIYS
jgi:uroporphyrinogen decarboxylase